MKNDITFVRDEYVKHLPQMQICEDIYEGISTSIKHLVKNSNEYQEDFDNRKKRATLNNFVERIVSTMVGEIFRKSISYNNISERDIEFIDNACNGLDLNQFSKDIVSSAILYGKAYILVDIPKIGGIPYFTKIIRPQLINWRKDSENKFKMAVIKEYYQEDSGFSLANKLQYRHIKEDGNIDIYRTTIGNKLELVESITTSYNYCPLFEIDIDDVPPLYDIAKVNIKHLNFQSSQDDYLLEALTPMLFGKALGIEAENDVLGADIKPQAPKMVIGVRSANFADDPEASLEWVEMSGQTYDISSKHLQKMEDDMSVRALRLQSESIKTKTATQSLQENSEKQSRLVDIADDYQNTINNSVKALYEMRYSRQFVGEILVNKDFNISVNQTVVSDINQAFISGMVTQKTALEALNKTEVFDITDIDAEVQETERQNVGI